MNSSSGWNLNDSTQLLLALIAIYLVVNFAYGLGHVIGEAIGHFQNGKSK